jgi:hypothetical protein
VSFGVGWNMIAPYKPQNLLRNAGRSLELLVGGVCVVISVLAAALLIWCIYLLGYRKPPEDIPRLGILMLLVVVLAIAVGFSVIAFRLVRRGVAPTRLISPMLLRAWGLFFSLAGAGVLVDGIIRNRWGEIPYYCEVCVGSISMACAAFVLARRRLPEAASGGLGGQSGAADRSWPLCSEANRPSGVAGSRRWAIARRTQTGMLSSLIQVPLTRLCGPTESLRSRHRPARPGVGRPGACGLS